MVGKFTFSKKERLSGETHIQELFNRGSSFYLFPFKILFLKRTDADVNAHQVLITVSKKNFKKAVDRNHIKRRIREAYRLNKFVLPSGPFYRIGFIYTHKEILETEQIASKMVHVLRKLSRVSNPPDA